MSACIIDTQKMKKIILLAVLVLSTFFTNAVFAIGQKVDIVDINNNELLFIVNRNAQNTFTEYFVFQYATTNFSFLSQKTTFSLVSYTNTSITIQCDNEQLTFSVAEGTNTATQYYGYGVSKRNGIFSLNTPEIGTIFDVINISAMTGGGPVTTVGGLTCHSGGPGSTSCSATSGSAGTISSGSCEVSCKAGFYACCDASKIECRCVKETASSGITTGTATTTFLSVSPIAIYYTH